MVVQLDYQQQTGIRQPRNWLWKLSCWLSATASVVGLGILGLYAATRRDFFISAGIIWLPAGGGIALVGGVLALIYIVEALRARPRQRAFVVKSVVALLLALAAPGVAWLCLNFGLRLSAATRF